MNRGQVLVHALSSFVVLPVFFHSWCCGSLYELAQYNEHLEANPLGGIETSVYSAPALVFALLFVSNQGYGQ
jgi:hypothetical protein